MLEAGKVERKQLHLTATTPAEEVLVDTEEGRGLLRALDFAPRDGSWCCQLGKQSAAQAVVACGVALEAAAVRPCSYACIITKDFALWFRSA